MPLEQERGSDVTGSRIARLTDGALGEEVSGCSASVADELRLSVAFHADGMSATF